MKLKDLKGQKVFHVFTVSSLRKVVYDEDFDIPVVVGNPFLVDSFISMYLPDTSLMYYYSTKGGFVPNVSYSCDAIIALKPSGEKSLK